jgi:hypothetical protein
MQLCQQLAPRASPRPHFIDTFCSIDIAAFATARQSPHHFFYWRSGSFFAIAKKLLANLTPQQAATRPL